MTPFEPTSTTMKFAAVVALLVMTNGAAAVSAERQVEGLGNVPSDVREFIGRRANCNYWRTEETSYAERTELGEDDYDSERAAQIQSALKRLRCSDVAKDEAALKQRYATNQAALSALERFAN